MKLLKVVQGAKADAYWFHLKGEKAIRQLAPKGVQIKRLRAMSIKLYDVNNVSYSEFQRSLGDTPTEDDIRFTAYHNGLALVIETAPEDLFDISGEVGDIWEGLE